MPVIAADKYVDVVDAERRKYERKLFVYLTVRLKRAGTHAASAARHGLDPASAAYDAIVGNDALELPGIAPGMTALLEQAYDAGWRRAERTAGPTLSLTTDEIPRVGRERLAQQARDYAASVASTIANGIRGALAGTTGGVKAAVALVRGWFRKSGYVVSEHRDAVKPSKTRGAAITHAVSAYNQGSDSGYRNIPGGAVLGWLDTAVLDDGTTEICRACDGLRLPIDHPFWNGRMVPRHHRCRTILVPLFTEFHRTPDDEIPWHVESAPGFGSGGVFHQ